MKGVRIGNGAGFWGDSLDAPLRLAEKGGLDFLTLEYLAELTLSILAHQRRRDPKAGYVPDFLLALESLVPVLRKQPRLRIITNAGGLNPEACAREAAKLLARSGLPDFPMAWVEGDDLLPRVKELSAAGESFRHFDTGAEPGARLSAFACANAYLGAKPMVEALETGARIVITGRVADASLTMAPAVHAFGWKFDDWDRLAMASVAGHLIECGAQVTGGLLSRWKTVSGYDDIGYPIAEIREDGSCLITKPPGTGGLVNCETVSEQLLYEIGDPAHYLTPDVDVDFTGIEIEETGEDRVRVSGAKGRPAPDTLKVSCAYENGFMARGDIVVAGSGAVEKAEACGEMVLGRLRRAGFEFEDHLVEVLGTGACLPGVDIQTGDLREVVLRLSVRDARKQAVERFCREISPLITSGPAGLAGYAGSRPKPRPVFSYWPTTVSRNRIQPKVRMGTAKELAA